MAVRSERAVVVSIEQFGDWTIFEEISLSGKRIFSGFKVNEAEGPGGIFVYVEGQSKEEVMRQISVREMQPDSLGAGP